MSRIASVFCLAIFAAFLLGCGEMKTSQSTKKTGETTAGGAEPSAESPKTNAPPTEKKLSAEEIKRGTDNWRGELEEKADELAQKGEAMERRLAEREATYKRRVDAGGADYSTKQEIEKLKKEIPKVWDELAKIEDAIAAGPPESIFAVDKPVSESVASTTTPAPATSTTPPKTGTTPPVGGVVTGSAPSGPKTVHVSGYTRKDGTYVAPHMRSSPRR